MQQDETLPLDYVPIPDPEVGAVEFTEEPLELPPLNVDLSRIFVKFDAESLLAQLRSLDANNENSEKIVKLVRDQLLSHTDWTQAADSPLSESVKQNFATFRQALRDVTNHPDYPDNITFPPMPSTK
jgi:hypothetical protein